MTFQAEITTARERAAHYLLGRQCPQGGFCFYRTDYVNEPNLADTYHAVITLRRLGLAPARPARVIEYLRGFPPSSQPWDLFHLTGAWRALDAHHMLDTGVRRRIDRLRIGPAPDRSSVNLTGWLERTGVILRLWHDFDRAPDRIDAATIVAGLLHDGGFGAGPNLGDTWQAIEILLTCGARPVWPSVVEFVDRLQSSAVGFRPTVTSWTARLDVAWAGVNCCRALGLPIRYPQDALNFVLACQSGSGGFANAPDALPDIQLTHRAIDTLIMLQPALAARIGIDRRDSVENPPALRDSTADHGDSAPIRSG